MENATFTITDKGYLKILNLTNRNIIYRNFSGKPGQYNKNGDRKFTVVIDDPEIAQRVASYGWNVKAKPSKNDGEEPFCTLEVRVRFDLEWLKPKIKQFTRNNSVWVTEENIGNFDYVEFEKVDLVLRPYAWKKPNGDAGISAQLSEMGAWIAQGVLEELWAEEENPAEDMPFDM